MPPDRFGDWQVIREIDRGGQATVFEVRRADIALDESRLRRTLQSLTGSGTKETYTEALRDFLEIVDSRAGRQAEPTRALKVLRSPGAQARERFQSEIALLQRTQHPSLIPLVDSNLNDLWFVTERYGGTLSDLFPTTRGEPLECLRLLRPVVDAVAMLHRDKVIHRDIKPDNILVRGRALVLGDFGIAASLLEDEPRLTKPLERVGSRDWMPTWASRGRLEDVTPQLDVYGLGKTIWAMVTGEQRLWPRYDYNDDFSISRLFPGAQGAAGVERLLRLTVVERKGEGIQDAETLLTEFDLTIEANERGFQEVSARERRCAVCGRGTYRLIVNLDTGAQRRFGLEVVGHPRFKIAVCNHCGHAQFFYFTDDQVPPAWQGKGSGG